MRVPSGSGRYNIDPEVRQTAAYRFRVTLTEKTIRKLRPSVRYADAVYSHET